MGRACCWSLRVCSVFDVTDGREFYGVGGVYRALVGADASRLLAKGLLSPETVEEAKQPLTALEQRTLSDWHEHYVYKYRKLGRLVNEEAHALQAPLEDGWRSVDS